MYDKTKKIKIRYSMPNGFFNYEGYVVWEDDTRIEIDDPKEGHTKLLKDRILTENVVEEKE